MILTEKPGIPHIRFHTSAVVISGIFMQLASVAFAQTQSVKNKDSGCFGSVVNTRV
jgi:hypothetical protein